MYVTLHALNLILYHSDINECENDMHDCLSSDHKVCTDTYGSFICECEQGYNNVSDLCEGTYNIHSFIVESTVSLVEAPIYLRY